MGPKKFKICRICLVTHEFIAEEPFFRIGWTTHADPLRQHEVRRKANVPSPE
jgi:hypothetical protein